jgi:hypothetical protein
MMRTISPQARMAAANARRMQKTAPPVMPAMPAVPAVPGMKKGGSASSRADGIAKRGKTRGTMVACGGGYMKGK